MAQQTNDLWKTLKNMPNTRREYAFDIAGVRYGPEAEVSHSIDGGLFEELSFGNANSAKLTLSLYAPDVPRGATIRRYVRLVNGTQASEWLPAGVYFINRRAVDDGYWTIEAFDILRRAEQSWIPEDEQQFPMPMDEAAAELARLMGTRLDPRTVLSHAYTVDYPASDPDDPDGANYTIRQELEYIAAAHGGNWMATGEGALLLVPLGGEPPETNYLVTQTGSPITIGGLRILV